MVDNLTPNDPQAAPQAVPKRGIAGLLASTTGRIVLGVIGLALILGVAAAIYFLAFSGGAETPGGIVPPSGGAGGSATTTRSVVPTEPAAVPLDDVFTFRDIFAPTMKQPSTSTVDGGGTSTPTTASPDTGGNTIFVQDTSVADGAEVATILYNGQTYTLGEGEQVGSSPWQVLRIDGDTVVMLYGDSQVTLTVGQGLTK